MPQPISIDQGHPLILGSASPRRRDILTRLGIPLVVRPVDVDEMARLGETADEYLTRVVDAKLAALLGASEFGDAAALLVADTAVVVGDGFLGKPPDDEAARAMLRRLSGREHRVSTRFRVAALGAREPLSMAQTVHSEVRFRGLSEEHIERYVATGEGRDKAGSYAVQGLGAFAVERVVGSYSNVVGLPACQVVLALEQLGLLTGFPFAPATRQTQR